MAGNMPGTGGRDYYIITVKGERGPVDRAELRELVKTSEVDGDDQVRNAFGRNLGTVSQVLATPSDRHGTTSDRSAAPARRVRAAPTSGPAVSPATIIVIAVLIAAATAVWLATRPADQTIPAPGPAPAPPLPMVAPSPQPVPVVQPKPPALLVPAFQRPIAITPDQVTAHGPTNPRYLHVPAINAADTSLATKWCDPVGTRDAAGRLSWIRYATGPQRITAYALATGDNMPVRNPRSWWLVGVRTDGSEQVLDSRSNETFTGFFQRRTFRIAEPGDYIAYRLDLLEIASQPQADAVQLSEFSLYESPPAEAAANGLPAGWATASIGNDGSPPVSWMAEAWTMTGAGSDIADTADQFRFAFATVPENATITACLIDNDAHYPWAKAGVMLRISTEPDSAFVALVIGYKRALLFLHRPSAGAPVIVHKGDTAALPVWIRLIRHGSTVTTRVSNNGNLWRDAGSVQLPVLAGPLLAGLALCSKVPGKPATVHFDRVEITAP